MFICQMLMTTMQKAFSFAVTLPLPSKQSATPPLHIETEETSFLSSSCIYVYTYTYTHTKEKKIYIYK